MELSISIGLSGNHMYSTGSVTPSNTAPGAPTITGITSGDGQLSVAFTAGTNGGGTISNYQFSTNAGTSWTTRSPSATTSPIVISGLTNLTSYPVRIRAVNEIGSGTESASSTATPQLPGMLVPNSVSLFDTHFVNSFGLLIWTNPSPMTGITGFDIEVKRNSVNTWTQAYTNTARIDEGKSLNLISILGTAPTGVQYDYRIRSTNGDPDTPTTSAWITMTVDNQSD
jgi:hypothetical protein